MSGTGRSKVYGRAYFDRWYRRPGSRIESAAALRRRVAVAVALAERLLERPIRSALDVGCGEGRWRGELLRLRPRLRYVGVDPSAYAVERFGRRRGLVRGEFERISELALGGPFDLVVCADVLHYLDDVALDSGLPGLVATTGGIAWLEALCREDEVEGDLSGLVLRPARSYRRRFEDLGLRHAGAHGWAASEWAERLGALESS